MIKSYLKIFAMWAGAIILLALMDTIIFHPQSWVLSWGYMNITTDWAGYQGFRQFADGWHLSKVLMELILSTAILFAIYLKPPPSPKYKFIILYFVVMLFITGAAHNLFFHLLFIL